MTTEAELVADALEELGYNELRFRAIAELRRLIAANRHLIDNFNQLKEDFDELKSSVCQRKNTGVPISASANIEELLGRYWELAFAEGKTGMSRGDEANEVLFQIRGFVCQRLQNS